MAIVIYQFSELQAATSTIEDLADDVAHHFLMKLSRYHQPTYDHSVRVAQLVEQVGSDISFGTEQHRKLIRAALLHDLGKLAIPRRLLNKPAPLTEKEWMCMEQHCHVGHAMVRESNLLSDEAYVIKHHHRWYAASNPLHSNYNAFLEQSIDLIAVCDAYDAIVSDRPYRDKSTSNLALEHMQRHAGHQFCPDMVERLCRLIRAELGSSKHSTAGTSDA